MPSISWVAYLVSFAASGVIWFEHHGMMSAVRRIDRLLKALLAESAPEVTAIDGMGADPASAILMATGDNRPSPSSAEFLLSMPRSASSTTSAQPQRGPQANSALWHIVFTRMVSDPRIKHYIERRMKDGRTKKEAVRCLKRYVAREVFAALPRSQFALHSPYEHR